MEPWPHPAEAAPIEPAGAKPAAEPVREGDSPVDLQAAAEEVSRQVEAELSEPEEQYQYPPLPCWTRQRPGTSPRLARKCAAIPSA